MKRAGVWLVWLAASGLAGPAAGSVAGLRQVAAQETSDRSVVLVTIDGLRWQEVFAGADPALIATIEDQAAAEEMRAKYLEGSPAERRAALLPFLWSIVETEGQLYGHAALGSEVLVENGKFFSYPGYQEILAGYPDPEIASNAKRPNPNVTVLEWLDGRPGFEGRVATFGSWDTFPFIVNEERSGVLVNGGWEPAVDEPLTETQRSLNALSMDLPGLLSDVRYDALTFRYALEHVRKHEPRVLYIALDETDSHAHAGRYDRYLEAARRFDRFLETLWATLQEIPAYRGRTTLIVTSDHGRGEGEEAWRNHGAGVEGAEWIWMAFLGPDTQPLGEVEGGPRLFQGQTAASVASAVGEDYAGANQKARRAVEGALRRTGGR